MSLALYVLGMVSMAMSIDDLKLDRFSLIVNLIFWPLVVAIGLIVGVYKAVRRPVR